MIAEIENAMIARINAAMTDGTLGYKLRTVKTYAGELDNKSFSAIVANFPAVWIVYSGEPKPTQRGQGFYHEPRFSIFCAARSLRTEQASRHGGAAGEIGSYRIVEDMRALFFGQDLELSIGAIAPGAIVSLLQGAAEGNTASVYALELSTSYQTNRPAPEGLYNFRHFHADWDFPPHGNVSTDLPNDTADAQDNVYLQGTGDPDPEPEEP